MAEISRSAGWRPSSDVAGSTLTAVLLATLVISALYFAREILVPIALAILLSFVLAPAVGLLQRLHIPRSLAVLFVVSVAFASIFALGAVMVSQVNQLASDLPGYQSTLREKIQTLRGAAAGTGTLERASEVLQDLSKELDKPKNAFPRPNVSSGVPASPDKPIPVEVRQPDPGALQTLVALITPLIHPLTTTGIVLVFVIFILIQRQDLRNRLIKLAGAKDIHRTTAAMDDAGQRLSRLFLTQLALNAGFGLVIGTGLWFIGVPSAPLWGMLAAILRFVPYVGAVIAAILPLVLAAAVGPDWSMALWTVALFMVVEPIAGHVIEPLLYGHSTGLSPVAVIASATFWTWLWGPVGLVLATPLTVCLAVVGRHVDQLNFLDVMFGDQPPLTPPELAYQRLLAGDPVEATEQAEDFLKEKNLIEYYEEVLLGALKLAAADMQRGSLDHERLLRIRDTVADIVDDLSEHEDKVHTEAAPANVNVAPLSGTAEIAGCGGDLPQVWRADRAVLCIPGSGLIDEAAAIVLTRLITSKGIGAHAEPAQALSISRVFSLDTKDVVAVCLCYVEFVTPAQIRYALRRLRRKAPQARLIVTVLGEYDAELRPEQVSLTDRELVKTLSAARKKIEALASSPNTRQTDNASPILKAS
jgi:predicted PurR-regulated permease PerM